MTPKIPYYIEEVESVEDQYIIVSEDESDDDEYSEEESSSSSSDEETAIPIDLPWDPDTYFNEGYSSIDSILNQYSVEFQVACMDWYFQQPLCLHEVMNIPPLNNLQITWLCLNMEFLKPNNIIYFWNLLNESVLIPALE